MDTGQDVAFIIYFRSDDLVMRVVALGKEIVPFPAIGNHVATASAL